MISNKFKEIAAILIVGFCLFAVISTVTYADDTVPGAAGQGGNLCGATGKALAHFMLYSVGYAAYALYGCLAIWGVVLLARKHLPAVISKIVGLVFFTIFLAAFLSHFVQGSPADIPGYGGLVGCFVSAYLTDKLALGQVGTRIILIVLFLITFILATDWVFFTSILALGRWLNERAVRWRERAAKRRALAAQKRRARQALVEERRAAAALTAAKGESAADGKSAAKSARNDPAEAAAATEPGRNGGKKDKAVAAMLKKEEDKQKAVAAAKKREPSGEQDAAAPAGAAKPAGKAPSDHGASLGKPARPSPAAAPPHEEADEIVLRPPPVKKSCGFKKPSLDLLENPEPVPAVALEKMISDTSALLERTLQSFKIEAEVVEIQRGPVITMFELELAPGIKVERIRALEDDIAMAVKAPSVRIVAPIPGKSTVGIEVPNAMRETVRLKEIFTSSKFKESKNAIPICLGKDAAGSILVDDLAKMPHLLVAGSTGSGKSVCLNSIIMSILFTRAPEQVRLILIDPKMVELSSFKNIPHLLCPVVTEMKRAGSILEWATRLMDSRYSLLHLAGVRNIYAYNKLAEKELRERLGDLAAVEDFQPYMPFIVIVVDELADLMMIGAREVETTITRLAQKSRAVGIHLVLATQRPSTNVITGLIKANMPTRIGFMVASKIDSRVILDANGAEKLLGQGDMLYMPPAASMLLRAQGTFISDEEVRGVTAFLRELAEPEYEPELSGKSGKDFDPRSIDDLYEQAVDFVIETQRGSASLLQRHFSIGYTRASRLIDLMNQDGILGDYKGSQAREVLLTLDEWNQRKENNKQKGKASVRT